MREKLIELLKSTPNVLICDEASKTIADHLIANGVTFATDNNVGGWIPVTERLPQNRADVLVVAFWHETWQTMIGWHNGEKWRVITPHGEREPGGVTHWMPLMEPTKGE